MFPRVPPQTLGPDYYSTTTDLPQPSIDTSAASLSDDFNLALDAEFWSNAIEEDSFYSPLPFDASERGLWNGRFVPPPPRPPNWDDSITSDGLTTCDLCTWASHERNAYSLDGSISGKFLVLFWVFFSLGFCPCLSLCFSSVDYVFYPRSRLSGRCSHQAAIFLVVWVNLLIGRSQFSALLFGQKKKLEKREKSL